jgi:hypothetical protein
MEASVRLRREKWSLDSFLGVVGVALSIASCGERARELVDIEVRTSLGFKHGGPQRP